MTLEALEPKINKLINPAVQVASGVLTFDEADQQYKGTKLICPHCFRYWSRMISNDDVVDLLLKRDQQAMVQHGMFTPEVMKNIRKDVDKSGLLETLKPDVTSFPNQLVVKYRKGMKDAHQQIQRFMHWFHLERGAKDRPCTTAESAEHAVAVGAMELLLQQRYANFPNTVIEREKDLVVVPGAPPTVRRPDLTVKQGQQFLEIYEIQRSVITHDDFVARTNHLLRICSATNWIFFRKAAGAMQRQCEWLKSMGLRHDVCWFDQQGKLQVEEGYVRTTTKRSPERSRQLSGAACRYGEMKAERIDRNQSDVELSALPKEISPAIVKQSSGLSSPATTTSTGASEIWGYRVNDDVEAFLGGKWRKGTVRYFEPEPVVKVGGRYITIRNPQNLRQPQGKDQRKAENESYGQTNLFSLLNGEA